jgi:hypothetical protein
MGEGTVRFEETFKVDLRQFVTVLERNDMAGLNCRLDLESTIVQLYASGHRLV